MNSDFILLHIPCLLCISIIESSHLTRSLRPQPFLTMIGYPTLVFEYTCAHACFKVPHMHMSICAIRLYPFRREVRHDTVCSCNCLKHLSVGSLIGSHLSSWIRRIFSAYIDTVTPEGSHIITISRILIVQILWLHNVVLTTIVLYKVSLIIHWGYWFRTHLVFPVKSRAQPLVVRTWVDFWWCSLVVHYCNVGWIQVTIVWNVHLLIREKELVENKGDDFRDRYSRSYFSPLSDEGCLQPVVRSCGAGPACQLPGMFVRACTVFNIHDDPAQWIVCMLATCLSITLVNWVRWL